MPTPKAIAFAQAEAGVADSEATTNVTAPTLAGFDLSFAGAAADRHRFTAMWYAREKEDAAPEPVCRQRRRRHA